MKLSYTNSYCCMIVPLTQCLLTDQGPGLLAGTITAPVLPPVAVCGCQSQFHLNGAVTHIHNIVVYVRGADT